MTEMRPIIDLDYEATPDQMAVLMDGIEASLDHVVAETLIPDRGYAGMIATSTGNVVSIGTGHFYNAGKVYAFDTPQSFDTTVKLPVALKRVMLIIAYGTEQDTDPAPVNVLVEAQSTPSAPVYKAQTVPTVHRRLVTLDNPYGDEAANPVYPGYGLALPIAMAVLGPAGILSLINIVDGKVPNLADVAKRTAVLEAWRANAEPEISSIASDVAALANGLKNSTSIALIGRILLEIADLNAKVGIPTNAADSSSDYLLADTNSDAANPLYHAKTQEGIRFPDAAAGDAVLNIFNPFDPNGQIKNGILFPAYDNVLRGATGNTTGSLALNSYTYNSVSYTQKTMTRTRVRYGPEFTVCSNSFFWNAGVYDPISGIFKLPNGETFKAASTLDNNGIIGYVMGNYAYRDTYIRVQEFWTDSTSESYWDEVVQAPQTIDGFRVAETVLIGQSQWLSGIGTYFPVLDSHGDVTLLVCEALETGAPDPSAVLAQVTVPFSQLNTAMSGVIFLLPTPVFLEAGKRIAYEFVTTAGHKIGTTDGANFPQGTLFNVSPSGYVQGDLTKHLTMNFYTCKFRSPIVSVQLGNMQLSGGITGVDVLAGAVVPASTTLTYEVQLAGVWTALSVANVGEMTAGGNLNPNIPLRVTMAGTPDVMPALNLAQSNVHVSRPDVSFAHIWPKAPRTPPVSTSQIRVIERYESFDPAFHSAGCKLLTGPGYATQTAPSSYSDVAVDATTIERTYVFNLGAAVSSYKVLTTGTTTTALKTFHVAWIKDYVL